MFCVRICAYFLFVVVWLSVLVQMAAQKNASSMSMCRVDIKLYSLTNIYCCECFAVHRTDVLRSTRHSVYLRIRRRSAVSALSQVRGQTVDSIMQSLLCHKYVDKQWTVECSLWSVTSMWTNSGEYSAVSALSEVRRQTVDSIMQSLLCHKYVDKQWTVECSLWSVTSTWTNSGEYSAVSALSEVRRQTVDSRVQSLLYHKYVDK